MSTTGKVSPNYLTQLTWLRGIAALFVIVSHTTRATEVKYSPSDGIAGFTPLSLFDLGDFGVTVFFVLSGCTLYISNADKIGHNYVTNFYIKRIFRIWPAFAVSLIIYLGFGLLFVSLYIEPQGYWIEKQFYSPYSVYDVISYLTLTFNVTGPSGIFNNAYWSLPVEFQYYLIFPLIVISLRYAGIFGPISIGAILYLIPKIGLIDFDRNIVFTLAFSFCGGVLVGHIYKNLISLRIKPLLGGSILIALITLVLLIKYIDVAHPHNFLISGKHKWYGCIATIVVFVLLITKFDMHERIESFLQYYGTISYSTYLYHNLFVAIAVLFAIHFQIHNSTLRLLTTFFFTLIASYLMASLSYKYIEAPCITIGRRLGRRKENQ